RQHLKNMKAGSAIVDVAIDQGGCFETSAPTTHAEPTYIVDDIVHYCVANMPGAVARTSTFALNNATLPYIIKLANKGYQQALLEDSGLLKGLNIIDGKITLKEVAESLTLPYVSPEEALKSAYEGNAFKYE
ncbi:MAG: alanine dehydrogenase, partial [Vibrio casei]